MQGSAGLANQVLRQQWDVRWTVAERWYQDLDDAQPIVEVVTKTALVDGLDQVAVGGGDHPHVDLDRARPAHALELAILQHAQELDLQFPGQVAKP